MSNLSAAAGRLRYIDGLRGIAALWVAAFHLHGVGRPGELLAGSLPDSLATLLAHGDRGIDIFFVLSGFVIAYSIRGNRVDGRYAWSFFLRRSVRLDPPYWLCIGLAVGLNAISRLFLPGSTAELPTWSKLVANLLYLQDILGYGGILTVFWTLCLELQFYLVLISLVGVVHRFEAVETAANRMLTTVVVPVAVLALLFPAGIVAAPRGLFLSHWYMFLIGALTYWTLRGSIRSIWLGAYVLTLSAIALWRVDLGAGVTLATAISIYLVGRRQRLHDALGLPWLQLLGAASYSIYLLHLPIGGRAVTVSGRLLPDTPLGGLLAFAIGMLVTVVAALLFWRLVERPFVLLSRRFRPAATGAVGVV